MDIYTLCTYCAAGLFFFTVINMFMEISVGAVFLSGTWYVFSGTWYVFSGTWYDYRTYYIGVLMSAATLVMVVYMMETITA